MAPDSNELRQWAAPLLGHRLLERWEPGASPLQLLEEGLLHLSLGGQKSRLLIIGALDALDVLHLRGGDGEKCRETMRSWENTCLAPGAHPDLLK